MTPANDHALAMPEVSAILALARKSADQRVEDVRNFAELLAVNLDTLTPQQLASRAAHYREAARRAADYVAEGYHPEAHMTLIRIAGDYATHALTYEAALQDRGLA